MPNREAITPRLNGGTDTELREAYGITISHSTTCLSEVGTFWKGTAVITSRLPSPIKNSIYRPNAGNGIWPWGTTSYPKIWLRIECSQQLQWNRRVPMLPNCFRIRHRNLLDQTRNGARTSAQRTNFRPPLPKILPPHPLLWVKGWGSAAAEFYGQMLSSHYIHLMGKNSP